MKLQDLNIDTIIKNFEVLRKKQENTTFLPYLFKEFVWGNNGDKNDGKPFGDVVE